MDLNGISCIVSDTAGLREFTADPIEQEGINRARQAFKEAQLKVFVCDSSDINEICKAELMMRVI
jgi:tRNA modification GTPase